MGRICEEDMPSLLHRYPAEKILSLLHEVSQSADGKMDWNALVQKTATGITNAREYQMLWRHIAYSDELKEKVDDSAEPLDDDSDLEYELEAYPPVSVEVSAEAAACVKVLIGRGDSKVPNSSAVEAPLTKNIPNGQSSKFSSENPLPASMQGANVTVLDSVQKQSVPSGATGDGSDVANSTLSSRRKRKPWSEDEDQELMAAVEKCGEGNWSNIVRGDYKGERTASQLSQRWTTLKRRKQMQGGGNQSTGHVDTNRALQVALCDAMPTVGNEAAALTKAAMLNTSNKDNNIPAKPQNPQFTRPGGISSKPGTIRSLPPPLPPLKKVLLKPLLDQDSSTVKIPPKPGTIRSLPIPSPPHKKVPLKPLLDQDLSMVTKVAVAAGARIASPSEATLFKAAQANNSIHMMPKGGITVMKPSVSNPTASSSTTPLGPKRTLPVGKAPERPILVSHLTRTDTCPLSISKDPGSSTSAFNQAVRI